MKAIKEQKNILRVDVCMIPHKKKWWKGGEDAFKISGDACLVCIADGVGGWAKKGIDPAIFSRNLCDQVLDIYENLRHLKNIITITDS